MRRLLRLPNLAIVFFLFLAVLLIIWLVPFESIEFDKLIIDSEDAEVIKGFIEWFGVLYGLIIAFVLIEAWTNYNRVVEEIDREADALQLLDWSARYLGEDIANPITEAIQKYTNLVIEACGHDEEREEIRDAIFQLYKSVGITINSTANVPIGNELMKRLNEALDTRNDRIQHARGKVPKPLWAALLVNSLIWLFSFLGLEIKNIYVAAFIFGGAVFIVVSLLLIINDLGHPYSGSMKANFSSFEDLQKNLVNWGTPCESKPRNI